MIIENQGLPCAGEPFRFSVSGANGKMGVEAYIDSILVYEGECPDPPCHEIIDIPNDRINSVLRIIIWDMDGNTAEEEFTIIGRMFFNEA
jgi:hypothetical protein